MVLQTILEGLGLGTLLALVCAVGMQTLKGRNTARPACAFSS